MPARDLWSQIQKQLHGRAEPEQLRILRGHLDSLHDEWKGPYKDLRDRLRRQVRRLEGHDAVRSRAGQHDPFHVKRQGEATVVLVGTPNTGKSTLLQALTGAATIVADYPFSTSQPVPGMLSGDGGALQLIDTPPVVPGLADGQGPGRPLLHLLSLADVVAVVVNATDDATGSTQIVFDELATTGIEAIAGPLATTLQPRGKGGVRFVGLPLDREQEQTARSLVAAAHVEHAEIAVRTGFDAEQLRRQLDGDILLPVLLVVTSAQQLGADIGIAAMRGLWPHLPLVATESGQPASLEPIRSSLLAAMGRMPVLLLERATVDGARSIVLMPLASDVAAIAARVGQQERLKGARIWGTSVARPGQAVSLQHVVASGDQIFLQS